MRDRIPSQNFTGNKRNTGTVYEHRAARWLTSRGHEILALSFSCRFGDVTTQILIQTNSRGHPLNVLVPRRLKDKCSRYSFKKVSYPIDRLKSDK